MTAALDTSRPARPDASRPSPTDATAARPPLAPSLSMDGWHPLDCLGPRCGHCGGSGIVPDDGSVTGMIGWPLPCACAEALPPRVRALMRAARPARTTRGSGRYGGAA